MDEREHQRPDEDIDKIAPQKLLINFTRNRVLLCLGIALGLHIVVICGTSPRYIYEKINPEAKARRVEREEKAKQAALNATLAKGKDSASATSTVARASSDGGDKAGMDARKETDQYKEITSQPEDDEIPRVPDDIDISLEDTEF